MNINQIVDELFKDIPYSNAFQEIREQITTALENEYEKFFLKYNDSLLAYAKLLQQYGTLQQAAELAGYEKEEVLCWQRVSDIVGPKQFRKQHRKSKILILLFSLFATLDLIYIFLWITAKSPYYSIPLVLPIPYQVLFIVKYKKWVVHSQSYTYAVYSKIEDLSIRYFKKAINSIVLCISILFLTIAFILISNYRGNEVLSQIYSSLTLYEILIFCVIKNISYNIYFHFLIENPKEKEYIRHCLYISGISAGYWSLVILMLSFFSNDIGSMIGVCFGVIYIILYLIYTLYFRQRITFVNIYMNKRRIIAVGSLVVLLTVYISMRLDSWLLQPYINQIPAVQTKGNRITYQEDTGVYTIETEEEEFRILQLTDIHLGGSNFSYNKDKLALSSVYRLIEYSEPDLVIVTGDLVFPLGIMSFSFNNNAPIMQFASFMRNIGVPWVFAYGNHDTESLAILSEGEVDSLFQSLSFKNSRNLLYPYVQPDIYGRNNQIIEIRGKHQQLIQALFVLDSNSYIDKGINQYDYIHDDQVLWYEEEIQNMSNKEGHLISSLAFFHMPLNEYQEAYTLYKQGSTEVQYHFGEIGEKNEEICDSKYHSLLFEKAVELGSTKAMFCGHDHLNTIALSYKGIMLTYGLSIDYLAYPDIAMKEEQRGGTLIQLYQDSSIQVTPIKLKDIFK